MYLSCKTDSNKNEKRKKSTRYEMSYINEMLFIEMSKNPLLKKFNPSLETNPLFVITLSVNDYKLMIEIPKDQEEDRYFFIKTFLGNRKTREIESIDSWVLMMRSDLTLSELVLYLSNQFSQLIYDFISHGFVKISPAFLRSNR